MAPASTESAKRAADGDTTDRSVPKKSLFEDSEDDQEDGGATLGTEVQLKINEEYARRFEHNKKREELHRLQEKYKSANGEIPESESSSEDETEDDEAVLITDEVEAEIAATLQAIRNRDPKIYDKNTVFYKPFDPDAEPPRKKEEKPLTLRDYHRERYLKGDIGADDEDAAAPELPKTYAQEQADLKKSILSEINAAAAADDEEWSDDDAFIKPVKKDDDSEEGGANRPKEIQLTELDVANADKNPEEFLSKFMASRAWAPADGESKWQAFESDEGEEGEVDLAEEFEHAYNMRFEDPEKSNEFLKTYSRKMAAARSVRKEELTGRKKRRALEKERREAEKKEREAERARLRRLKIEEASEKLAKIKQAAGMSGVELKEEDWLKFLEDAWDNDKWEEEMKKRFGDEYYAKADDDLSLDEDDDDEDDEDGAGKKKKKKKKKPKKPKWDDDIDIKDIVPDFDDESKPAITLSDDDDNDDKAQENEEGDEDEDSDNERPAKKRKTSKELKKERIAAKRQAREELAKIEALVDTKMELDDPRALQPKSKKRAADADMPPFRYRETSPNSFGLTARDILLAPSDAALNQFAGLKKLATFRDAEKKRRDKKRLGKKARLRKWRRETFGPEYERDGPTYGFEALLGGDVASGSGANASKSSKKAEKRGGDDAVESNIIEGERKKKRKRSRNKSKKAVEAEE